jgi:hypothetical protein
MSSMCKFDTVSLKRSPHQNKKKYTIETKRIMKNLLGIPYV